MPYKRGKKYIGQVRKNGKRIEKVFLTRKEALKWEAETGKIPEEEWNGKTSTVSLFDWAQRYLSYSESRHSEKPYKEKRAMFRIFFNQIDPEMPVEDLTPGMVLDYLQGQMEERSGNATNKDRKHLIAGWNWGIRYMNLPSPNPCAIERMPEVRHPRYIPPAKDFWKVYDSVENFQDKVMLLTFLHTAGRRSEIFRLKVSDLDFENKRLRLSTRKREGGTLEYDWLPMTKELSDNLAEWLETRDIESEYVFACLDKTAFCQEYYGAPFKNRLHLMRRLCDKAGVKHFGFHAIRHLTAQQLYEEHGYGLAIIQSILRHRNPNTTEQYLKKIGLKGVREALEGLSFGNRSEKIVELRKAV